MVTGLRVDDAGKLRGVTYVDENDKVHEVDAKVVVLALGSNATARLLLTSTSKLFPHGAGNNHDVVGRNISSHAYVDARGFGVAFMDYSHDNPGFICGGVLHTDFVFTPAIFAQGAFPGVPRWGRANKDFIRTHYRKMIRVCGPHQQTPRWENRLRLDPAHKDYWGLPFVVAEGREHPNDAKARRFLSDRAKDLLAACGAKLIQQGNGEDKPRTWWNLGGQHQSGSCRMGRDPAKSVCDAWGRVWDFPNLFVADGSLHVNNGGMNPVLTIMALGFRVGQGIVAHRRDLGV